MIKNAFEKFKIRFDYIENDPEFDLQPSKILQISRIDLEPLNSWLEKENFNSSLFKNLNQNYWQFL